MTEDRTTNDRNRNKGKSKHKYEGLVTDGPVKGVTVNPGRDQAVESKKLLKATIVHVSGQPTLKIVTNIIKYRTDIKAVDYEPEEPDPALYTKIIKVTLTDRNGNLMIGEDGSKIIANQPWVYVKDTKERLWDDYNRKMKRALDKRDELEDGKGGTLFLLEGQFERSLYHHVENATHETSGEAYKDLFK